jgi:hypothetical protein
MTMRINLGTIEVTDRQRRALTMHDSNGADTTPASREDVRKYVRQHGEAGLDALAWDRPEFREALNAARG